MKLFGFFKKKDGLDLDDLGMKEDNEQEEFKPAFPQENPEFPQRKENPFAERDFKEPAFQQTRLEGTEMQLINAKLDLITQKLEAIDRRLQDLEKLARQ